MNTDASDKNGTIFRVFRVGDWNADPASGLIKRGDISVKLEPKVMDVLCYLAARHNQLVMREELELEVWRGALVGYDAVTRTIIKLRKALGDNAKNPRYIATVPKRGYRLIASVDEVGEKSAAERQPQAEQTEQINLRFQRKDLVLGAGISLVLITLLSLLLFMDRSAESIALPDRSNVGEKPSIAVLPFANMSGNPEQEYFADGITEDIITDFSRLSNLTVIAWNTSSSYKGKSVQPQTVGSDLGVDYVLTGSIRRGGDRLRITAQLVDAASGQNIWAERYDRTLTEVFTLQDEVTTKIVSALAVRMTSSEKDRLGYSGTNNIAAYDAFLRGQQYVSQRTQEGNQRARLAYRQAIKLDPTYARAYGALAVVLIHDFRNGWAELSTDEVQARATELVKRAVALDSSSPQAYWALGFVYLYTRQYDQAEVAAKRAVELAPNYADGYGLLGSIHNFLGQAEDALEYMQKAMALNPHYTSEYPLVLGRAYYTLGRYADAIDALQEALSQNVNALYTRLMLASSYVRVNRQDDAEWEIEQIEILNPGMTLTRLSHMFPLQNRDEMNAFLDDLRKAGLPD